MPLGLENPFHLLVLLVVILLLFGAKRLPEMGRSVGQGMREFKDGVLGHDAAETHNPAGSLRAEPGEEMGQAEGKSHNPTPERSSV